MPKLITPKGETSKKYRVFIQDSTSTAGEGLTGLVFNSAGLTAYYIRDGAATPTVINLVNTTVGTWTSGGFKEVSAANMPGVYEIQLPDAVQASGADDVSVILKGATNMAPLLLEIQLSTVNLNELINPAPGAFANQEAADATVTTGSETLTYEATLNPDNVYHQVAIDGGVMDFYYEFIIPADAIGTRISHKHRLNRTGGGSSSINVFVWDWSAPGWATRGSIGSINNSNNNDDVTQLHNLLSRHTGRGANAGKIRFRLEQSGLSNAEELFTDEIFVTYGTTGRSSGYEEGRVWINTVNGKAGIVPGLNGTAGNPSLTFADAKTINDALGFGDRYKIIQGSSIQFDQAYNNGSFDGQHWALNLNGKSISGAAIHGATVSGDYLAAALPPHFEKCEIGDITGPRAHLHKCGLAGNIINNAAGVWLSQDCFSEGDALPSFDFGSGIANVTINMLPFHGRIEFKNFGATGTDVCNLTGDGQYTFENTCDTGATLNLAGRFKETDGAAGKVTVIKTDQDAIDLLTQQTVKNKILPNLTTDKLQLRNDDDDGVLKESQLLNKLGAVMDLSDFDLTIPAGRTEWVDP